ncbi:MAG: hypothetical protein GF313_00190, partial [Caldithrix sp.]|nr:hypothetical protein [Caldithrix sp.]
MKRQKIISLLIIMALFTAAQANQGGNDGFGHMWTDTESGGKQITYSWIDAKDGTSLFGSAFNNSITSTPQTLPFSFNYYDSSYTQIYISSNGWITFDNYPNSEAINDTIPSSTGPSTMIAPFWDNLNSTAGNDGGVYFKVSGNQPNRRVIIEWDIIERDGTSSNSINFQVVLHEHSNLIKFQYNNIDNDRYGGGNSASIGIKNDSGTGLSYAYNDSVISSGMAILFHNKTFQNNALATILPQSIEAGSYASFNYSITDLDITNPVKMGKADRFSIANPFTSVPAITGIKINDYDAYIQNSQDKPSDPGYATWYYDNTNDSIVVKTSDFDAIDSMLVSFNQSMPQQTSTGNAYPSTLDARLDSTTQTANTNNGYDVDVLPAQTAYYTLSPAGDQAINAGDSLDYTLTAYDEFDNEVTSQDTVILSASGSSTAAFISNDTLVFQNAATLNFAVTDTMQGDFTVKVRKQNATGVTGESGLITVNTAAADHLVILSSQDSIRVGNERLLQVAVEDVYTNRIAAASVTFQRIQGNGVFSDNELDNISTTSNANGEASALYTASDSTGFGEDHIRVTTAAVDDTIRLPLQTGPVSYYALSPSGDQAITAGDTLDYTLTAYDEFDNEVTSQDTVILSASGSSTAAFISNDTLVFQN